MITTKENIIIFLKSKKQDFKKDMNLIKLGLFGSYALETNTETSDIDIIVEFEPNTDNLFEKKKLLKEIIKNEFGKNVDVCREKYIKPYFKTQILKSAIYV